MFKLVATIFAAILAVVCASPKPGVVAGPVAYSAPFVRAPVVSAYSAPVVSAYSAYSAPVVSAYGAPLAYSAHHPVAYSAHRPVTYLG